MATQFLIVDPNGNVSKPDNQGQLSSALAIAATFAQPRQDGRGWGTEEVGYREAQRHLDSVHTELNQRADSFSPGLGAFNPRDLTYKFKRILEERKAPLSSHECFPLNTEPPPGSLNYEQSRGYATGEAVVYRGGNGADIPAVAIGNAHFSANIVYLVSKAEINWLESLRSNMTGLDTQARKMRQCRRVIDELENKWTFNGSEPHGLYGLLNHPYIDTALSSVSYNTSSGDTDDIVTDFGTWANYAENESGGANQPDTCLMATKLMNSLATKPFGDNKDKSVLAWIKDAHPHIKVWKSVPELNDAGGTSIHAMAFIRGGMGPGDSSAEIVKSMSPTLLTPDQRSLVSSFFLASGFGGLNHREAGDNLIVYVDAS